MKQEDGIRVEDGKGGWTIVARSNGKSRRFECKEYGFDYDRAWKAAEKFVKKQQQDDCDG